MEKKKVKVEEILAVQKDFRAKYPKVLVGVAELRKQGVIRLEARVASDEDAKDIPTEFAGYTVNTMVVSEKRFKELEKIMQGDFSKEE